jgi:antitoxin (DNA-binding transcriptional repressor) of toxin-antitoxin stability system
LIPGLAFGHVEFGHLEFGVTASPIIGSVPAVLVGLLDQLGQARYLGRMPTSYGIGEAKTQLSKLVHMAEEGEEVVLRRGRHPVVRLVAISAEEAGVQRKPGRMRGRVSVPDDFDDWPEDVAQALGILD